MNDRFRYVRIQGRDTAYRTGMPVGIFSAVWRLERAGLLNNAEKELFHEIDYGWFEKNLPNPPFYDDDMPGKPITYFKTASAGFMVDKLQPLMDLLEKYGCPYDMVYTNFPGRIVYEDEWQVAVYSDKVPGRITLLSWEHLPLYAEVIRQSFETVAQNFGWTQKDAPTFTAFITDERLMSKINDDYMPFGYFSGSKLVGFVSLTAKDEGIYELNNLAVLPEYRHSGYGKEMIDFSKNKVKELGGNKITIGIVEENTVLKDWYIANGFRHIGTKKFEHQPFTAGFMEFVI